MLGSKDAGKTVNVVVTASQLGGQRSGDVGGDGHGDDAGAAAGEYVAADDQWSDGGWGYVDGGERFVVERSDRLQLSVAGLQFVRRELLEHFWRVQRALTSSRRATPGARSTSS